MLRRAWESQGVDLSPWEDMPSRLNPSHPLWNNQRSTNVNKPGESTSIRGFHSINSRVVLVPSGPWPTDENQRMVGSLARLLFTNIWKGLQPLLLMGGMEPDQAQAVVEGLLDEYTNDRVKSYVKYRMWHAKRI